MPEKQGCVESVRHFAARSPSCDDCGVAGRRIAIMLFVKRIAASLLRIMAGVPIVSLLLCGLLLLVLSVTMRGRSVGLSAALLAVVCYCSVGFWNREWFRRRRGRFYGVLLPASILLYVAPAIFAPGGGSPDGIVRDSYLQGRHRSCRYAPWNVVPEMDQVHVGICAAAVRDPYMGSARRTNDVVIHAADL